MFSEKSVLLEFICYCTCDSTWSSSLSFNHNFKYVMWLYVIVLVYSSKERNSNQKLVAVEGILWGNWELWSAHDEGALW